jgi:DNA-binding MarR family transcriptional regulator
VIKGQFKFIRPNRDYRELLILSEIAVNPHVSQRALGRSADITAAMVNHYILELVANEYVQVEGTTNRSMTYHLTPAGAERKAALQGMMYSELSSVFAEIKTVYCRSLKPYVERGKKRAAVLGSGEKTELLALAAREAGMDVVGPFEEPSEIDGASVDVILDCRNDGKPVEINGVPVERF